jgi:hypothetical protein
MPGHLSTFPATLLAAISTSSPIEAHDLIAFGLVAGDRADADLTQLLNKLRARGLVFNQDHSRPEEPGKRTSSGNSAASTDWHLLNPANRTRDRSRRRRLAGLSARAPTRLHLRATTPPRRPRQGREFVHYRTFTITQRLVAFQRCLAKIAAFLPPFRGPS